MSKQFRLATGSFSLGLPGFDQLDKHAYLFASEWEKCGSDDWKRSLRPVNQLPGSGAAVTVRIKASLVV